MSPIESLPPDQQAVLGLLLRQGKTYDEVGEMLRIDRESVRWRAHTAVNSLAPPEPDAPIEGNHWRTVDYLLGQQTASERAETRELLEGSAEERAWARSMAAELRPMAADDLPEIPADPAEVDPAFETVVEPTEFEGPGPERSRLGGVLLLGGLGVLILVAIVLAVSGGGDDKGGPFGDVATTTPKTTVPHETVTTAPTSTPSSTTTPTSTKTTPPASTTEPTSTTRPATTAPNTAKPKDIASINLAVPGGKATKPIGSAEVFSLNGSLAANIVAQDLPPGGHEFAYAIWLVGTSIDPLKIGFTPNVKEGVLTRVLAPLPKNVNSYKTLELTKETTSVPLKPGPVVLQGALPHLPEP
jgi:hypothetical protein